jgi:cell division protein FtsZ
VYKNSVENTQLKPNIKVLGIGGGGGNAVNNLVQHFPDNLNDFIVCNTDAQALQNSMAKVKIQLGAKCTKGLGAGANPEIGANAAKESIDQVLEYVKDADMVFITAGMGGGTGTGAAPEIGEALRNLGILVVGIVTKPFSFEGSDRMRVANAGIERMKNATDTLLVISNQNLFRIANENTSVLDAFQMADDVLSSGVRTFIDLMTKHGLINLDFADISTAMRQMEGSAVMGTGEASGENRAIDASEQAIACPLLNDTSIKGAKCILINIAGGSDLKLFEIDAAVNFITSMSGEAKIIFGTVFDDALQGKIRVSFVATGITDGYSVGFNFKGNSMLNGNSNTSSNTNSILNNSAIGNPSQNDVFYSDDNSISEKMNFGMEETMEFKTERSDKLEENIEERFTFDKFEDFSETKKKSFFSRMIGTKKSETKIETPSRPERSTKSVPDFLRDE